MVWLPFAAGGTVAAFLLPAVMLAALLVSLGALPADALSHDRIQALVGHPAGKLAILVVLALPLWHAAHRLRMTLQDLGVRRPGARRLVARLCYGVATLATAALLYGLLPAA